MPIENLEEEGLAKNPNLELSQLRFLARTSPDPVVKQECIDQLMNAVTKNSMAPFYTELCEELGIQVSSVNRIQYILDIVITLGTYILSLQGVNKLMS